MGLPEVAGEPWFPRGAVCQTGPAEHAPVGFTSFEVLFLGPLQ